MTEGRCITCKKQVEIQDGEEVVMKNGMKAMKGNCACGTTVFRILGLSDDKEKLMKAEKVEDRIVRASLIKRWIEEQVEAIIGEYNLDYNEEYEEVFEWVMDNADLKDKTKKIVDRAGRKFAGAKERTGRQELSREHKLFFQQNQRDAVKLQEKVTDLMDEIYDAIAAVQYENLEIRNELGKKIDEADRKFMKLAGNFGRNFFELNEILNTLIK